MRRVPSTSPSIAPSVPDSEPSGVGQSTSPNLAPDAPSFDLPNLDPPILEPPSLEFTGLEEPISPSPYSAKLLGWSDEELASSDFFRLVDAIRWLTDAEQNGAIAKRAAIYSATGGLVWHRSFAREEDQRQRVMKYNALRILFQID
jgi:hypothetical protein